MCVEAQGHKNTKGYPLIRSVWCSGHWRPPGSLKMTSDVGCDDVWWGPYLDTSQRNHDPECTKWLIWAVLVYILQMVLAVN
jgi:hypothetical protein